ncbi:50S ribosomal protein L16 chloroplastic, partial [Bienertia sinuspersici]
SPLLRKTSDRFPATRSLWQNSVYSPALGSVIRQPRSGFSLRLSESVRYNSTSGVYANVRKRFIKQRRNRGEMKGVSDNVLSFGKYALQALEPAWITSKQILAGQLAIKRNMRGGKLFMRIFPHKPISLKPAETRMGRGKGNIAFWVAGVRAGRIIYEINGVPESVARKAITVAASKFPVRTKFIRSSS